VLQLRKYSLKEVCKNLDNSAVALGPTMVLPPIRQPCNTVAHQRNPREGRVLIYNQSAIFQAAERNGLRFVFLEVQCYQNGQSEHSDASNPSL